MGVVPYLYFICIIELNAVVHTTRKLNSLVRFCRIYNQGQRYYTEEKSYNDFLNLSPQLIGLINLYKVPLNTYDFQGFNNSLIGMNVLRTIPHISLIWK